MRTPPWPSPVSALGTHYRDICPEPDACRCCSLWPRPDEGRARWAARVRDLLRRETERMPTKARP